MVRGDASGTAANADAGQASKPKRVRTGCLTCRERHLKCDEGLPNCQNCRKSSRTCKRGIKLNFIDITVKQPPILLTSRGGDTRFEDNSREIASEYKGGLAKYGLPETPRAPAIEPTITYDFGPNPSHAPMHASQALPPIQGMLPDQYQEELQQRPHDSRRDSYHQHTSSHSDSGYTSSQLANASYSNPEQPQTPYKEIKSYLNTPDEVLYIQIFIEEVGLWMDSMDPHKHFSRLLPFNSLSEPMLLNAFLACGARHMSLVNLQFSEEKALYYYNTATTHLLNALQDPNRDTVICATTAVILNVYEIMCERALQRMNHIAGARALIKECRWNAKSTGIGAACFWLNVGMELLSCLHFNWQVAWDPDEWGVDMDFSRESETNREEVWTYRILYIVAKIANFRAAASVKTHEGSPRTEEYRLQHRYAEWQRLKHLADSWNECIPRTMHPLAYLEAHRTRDNNPFPEVYLIKRTTIVARLFYHTAMVLLAQINPVGDSVVDEMRKMQSQHSTLICGIVAHTKDRGVASVALRSLAIASECLTNRREQEEVLAIFERIRKNTGWRIGFVKKELPLKWGWTELSPPNTGTSSSHSSTASSASQVQQPVQQHQQAPQRRATAPTFVNPLAGADFALPQHPYQSYYVPASVNNAQVHHAGIPSSGSSSLSNSMSGVGGLSFGF
ncbi:hypothetical protein NA57DRAFT_32234 [Rhizodiscina lignyota]|uniref:Zn(2)-C6 fungal-type domain-containing protein n=1 Tax=Rhizodiscina lignyota TaxID=1504668 RepID=A0A9P4MA62_9PEZI|nr:hypothetical protein NA57DRAFT_32234 [Rhizodiscina lignyota]